MNNKIIVIAGPTAVGKTEFAIETALKFNGEVVSCDSMQLYKFMDIGSAKPTKEECARVTHHLIDEIDPRDNFSVVAYEKLAKTAIDDILSRGKTPVIAGGTGLYLNSLIYDMDFSAKPVDSAFRKKLEQEGIEKGPAYLYEKLSNLDSESASRIHPNNMQKVIRAIEAATLGNPIKDIATNLKPNNNYRFKLVGLTRNREELYDRINKRVDILMELGLLEEVEALLNMGLVESDISMKGIGYKEIIGFYNHEYSLEEAIDLVKKNTRRYAKRQLTWFKRYDEMEWFNLSDFDNSQDALEDIFKWIEK